ncbi:MAG TPA: glycosyltransferase [Egibacteraceae bacterium]|nr:glycosyltransferase [Egibacteraceae bacterium]
MRIVVATVVHHPQDARIFYRQIPALLDAGHDVTYIAPWAAFGLHRPESLHAVDVVRASGRRRLGALLRVRRLLRTEAGPADMLMLHDPELVAALAFSKRPVTVWDVHEDTAQALADKPWLPPTARPIVKAAVRALERLAERRLHLTLAEDSYQSRFQHPHVVVPNDTVVPPAPPPAGMDRVVYLGRLSTGRGAHDLLTLSRLLHPRVSLHLIGQGDAELLPLLEAGREDGRLRWHGFVPNARALPMIEGALAGLSLLKDEPNYRASRPTKVVEYMARGVPVITTPLPLAAELVTRHRCGVVVPFNDPQAVADAVDHLRTDSEARQAMATRGHAAARTYFNWSDRAPRFVEQLETWAQASSSRRSR